MKQNVTLTPRWSGGGKSSDPLYCKYCREITFTFVGPCEIFNVLADHYQCSKCGAHMVMSLRVK